MKKKTTVIELSIFIASVTVLAFLYGFAADRYKLFPYYQLNAAIRQAKWVLSDHVSTPHHLYPIVYQRHGARIIDANKIQPGLTLLTSYWADFDWRPGIKIINAEGRTVHEWKTIPSKIWPDAANQRDIDRRYVHGSYLFPNGDVLFNVEYVGLVRMDSCGVVKWRLDYHTNHAISRDEDGNFWVPAQIARAAGNKEDEEYLGQFAGLKARLYEDRALKVSPDGEILTDISLLKTIYDNHLERYIEKFSNDHSGDIFHLNDIEALSAKMAADYPMFEAGDILVSLKFLHMVMVMDPDTGVVKWYNTDVAIKQHDPDFTGNGWITIFDNNSDHTPRGEMLGGSRIVAIKPHTGETRIIYPTGNQSNLFYTEAGGKWQLLDNNNLLITEARAGRAFEITPDGETVWEWIHQPYDNDLVPEVLEASRYSITPEQVASWPCGPEV